MLTLPVKLLLPQALATRQLVVRRISTSVLVSSFRIFLIPFLFLSTQLVAVAEDSNNYTENFSNTAGSGGWWYKYCNWTDRHKGLSEYVDMTFDPESNSWIAGTRGGDAASIRRDEMFQNAEFDPLLVWIADKDYQTLDLELSGIVVNDGGEGYVDIYRKAADSTETVLTLAGEINQTLSFSDIRKGDAIVIGKVAGFGENYGRIEQLSPRIVFP